MAEASEWKTKDAALTVEKASLEFDVHPNLIWGWINSGEIECLRGATKSRQWAKVLRTQVESRINLDPVGALHLARMKRQAALIKVEQNIACLKKMLDEFQNSKIELAKWLAANPMPE